MRDIGKNIKALRQEKNLTQEALAERLFVTRQTVSNYENGKTRPDVDMIMKIAQVLDTDANAVFYGLPAPPERKSTYRRLIFSAVLLGAVVAIFLVLLPLERRLQQRYIISLTLVLYGFLAPVIALIFGWLLLHGLSMLLRFKELEGNWVKYARCALLVFLCILLLFTLLITVPAVFRLKLSNVPLLISTCCYGVLLLNTKATAFYALLGAALRLFDFPRDHAKPFF